MSGESILHEILARGNEFGHRHHVELTWRHLEEHAPEAARGLVADAVRKVAAAHGAPEKFHATITGAWWNAWPCIASAGRPRRFDEFIERNAALLDPKLLGQHYSRELLASDAARAAVVEPDIRPLPLFAA